MSNERLGIVEQRAHERKVYGRFVDRRVERLLSGDDVQASIQRQITKRLKAEIERIVERQTAERIAEIQSTNGASVPSIKAILRAVSEATGFSVLELISPRRARPVSRARCICYWLMKTLRADSLPSIGRALGNRDHTTIMHGLRKWPEYSEQQPIRDWLLHPAIGALLVEDSAQEETKEAA